MKKYITVAALLAAGTAFANAETLATIDTTDAALKSYWDFSTGNTQTAGSFTSWNPNASQGVTLPSWNEDGEYGELSVPATTQLFATNAGLKAADGFTVSFDVNNFGAGTLLSMSNNGNMGAAWRSISISNTINETTGECTLNAKFHGEPTKAVTYVFTPGATDWTTLTLVGSVDATATSTLILNFYVNGTHIGTSTSANATNITGANPIPYVQFGYYGAHANSAKMNIDNVLIYSRALTSDQVKALTIPEPSAFGLLAGIGALALVASRRRRK